MDTEAREQPAPQGQACELGDGGTAGGAGNGGAVHATATAVAASTVPPLAQAGQQAEPPAAKPGAAATPRTSQGGGGGGGRRGRGGGGGGGGRQGKAGAAAAAAGFMPSDLPPDTVIEDAASAPQPQDYVFVDGLRLVRPYYFDFKCHVKARQDGRPLLQLMAEEFPMLGSDYYAAAVATGRLRVEGSAAAGWAPERPLRSGSCIRHFIHRHEPPVLAGEVQILGITPDFVAVNKPACLPVHTVGQYRKNTVMGVIQSARPDLWPLHPTYRLDKPVSGVLLLARSSAAAARMRVLLEERGCSKAYVARVQGVFPDTEAAGAPLVVDVPLGWDAKTNHARPVPAAARAANGPTANGNGPAGAARAGDPGVGTAAGRASAAAGGLQEQEQGPDGVGMEAEAGVAAGLGVAAEVVASSKPAVTLFRRLSVSPDGLTSVVEAVPLTGRTHQIRVHLQHIGHPIANDTQYGGSYGLPLFFRRGMGGPARPHVNGERRRVAGERATEPAGADRDMTDAADGSAAPRAAAAATAAAAACGCAAEVTDGEGGADGGASKRQRLADDAPSCTAAAAAAAGGDGGGAATAAGSAPGGVPRSGPGGAAPGPAASAAAAVGGAGVNGGGGGGGGGPNCDAALVAFSSERYHSLYTRPEFQVPGSASDPLCPHCPCLVPEGYPIDLEPLYLHARRYAAPGPEGAAPPGAEIAAAVEGGAAHTGVAPAAGVAGGAPEVASEPGASGEGVDGGWCFEAPLPEWAQPGYVAVPAGALGT